MSHYTRNYSKIPAGPARQIAALTDAREYIADDERFNLIIEEINTHCATLDDTRIGLSFAGIQGEPVVAMFALAKGQGFLND